jgi:hypothetical protein
VGGILIGRDDPPADRQIDFSHLDAAGGRELAISLMSGEIAPIGELITQLHVANERLGGEKLLPVQAVQAGSAHMARMGRRGASG